MKKGEAFSYNGMAEAEKGGMEFWMFDAGDPGLLRFCDTYADIDSLYCVVYIRSCLQRYPDDLHELLHLHSDALLLIDPPLLPLYAGLQLDGCFMLLSEVFCETVQTRALFRFCFYHKTLEALSDSGSFSEDQEACITLIREEYRRAYDAQQPHMLRNLMRNLLLLSAESYSFTMHLKAGHLLLYAEEFLVLLNKYAFTETKRSFYAGKIGITEAVLAQVLETVFHKTFREIRVNHTVIKAMKQLVFGEESITQIAHELNCDVSALSRLFVKGKGMLPQDLRLRYREILNYI